MTVRERHNRVNMYHCLRDDMVVLLPHLAYRNSTIGFGDGAVVAREDATTIGIEVLHMLDYCATVDTKPLEEKHDAAMDRLRRGFELSHDEFFPTFDNHVPDNWGRIYERYPEILCNTLIAARYFTTAEIDDSHSPQILTFSQSKVIRKGERRGIYQTHDSMTIPRGKEETAIGRHVSERLGTWRPKPNFLARLIS
jgi:hypothetical protein